MASVIGFGPVGTGRGNVYARRDRAPAPRTIDRVIESEIIPRLLVTHLPAMMPAEPVASTQVTREEVEQIATLAITLEAHELLAEVEQFVRRGVCVERILVDLLAPAARYLGDGWERDDVDFVDVTMGLWRLQEVLRELAARTPPAIRLFGEQRAALFAPLPGDQHSFGTAMVEECFARAGWDTALLIDPTRGELLARLANQRFDLVGLTVSCGCHIAPLSSLVRALRNVSQNPNLCVLLGGPALLERPELAAEAGADGTAATAVDALELADHLTAIPLRAAIA